jgi:hypothetical protein
MSCIIHLQCNSVFSLAMDFLPRNVYLFVRKYTCVGLAMCLFDLHILFWAPCLRYRFKPEALSSGLSSLNFPLSF